MVSVVGAATLIVGKFCRPASRIEVRYASPPDGQHRPDVPRSGERRAVFRSTTDPAPLHRSAASPGEPIPDRLGTVIGLVRLSELALGPQHGSNPLIAQRQIALASGIARIGVGDPLGNGLGILIGLARLGESTVLILTRAK